MVIRVVSSLGVCVCVCVCVYVQAGYVDGLQGAVLFEALLAEDADADRIALLPDVAAMLTQ